MTKPLPIFSSVKNDISLRLSGSHSDAILRYILTHGETEKELLQHFKLSWVSLQYITTILDITQ